MAWAIAMGGGGGRTLETTTPKICDRHETAQSHVRQWGSKPGLAALLCHGAGTSGAESGEDGYFILLPLVIAGVQGVRWDC